MNQGQFEEFERQEVLDLKKEKELQEKLEAWLDMPEPVVENIEALENALYLFREKGLFIDFDPVSVETAIMYWKIVQRIRLSGLPHELLVLGGLRNE